MLDLIENLFHIFIKTLSVGHHCRTITPSGGSTVDSFSYTSRQPSNQRREYGPLEEEEDKMFYKLILLNIII